jgi:hypothetical protein
MHRDARVLRVQRLPVQAEVLVMRNQEERLDHITRLVALTSSNLVRVMSEVELLLPKDKDRAEFYARLAVNVFGLSYSYSRNVMLDKLTDKERQEISVKISEFMRDAADVLESGKSPVVEFVK